MSAEALQEREGLPDALRVLMQSFPRESWRGHENFGALVQFWMQRHEMFRQLTKELKRDTLQYDAGKLDLRKYQTRISQNAGMLLNELHAHHQIEDHHYFPKLIGLDPRLQRGFDLLESDHEAMDDLLHDTAKAANAVLQGGHVGPFSEHLERFDRLLGRHLTDEEEIIVPVILKSGFSG